MDNKKDNRYYIGKIITDLAFIVEHTKSFTQEELKDNEVLIDSVMFRLIQVAENSDKLTDEFKNRYSCIQWRAVKGMRNKIVHEYGNVDLKVIYDTVKNDIPKMLLELKEIADQIHPAIH
ncbi:DUF86 domain-containing protein [Treponema sp. OMZ 840]|uniref:HepT-like ribonuclease domain-containing protein n=1 Tax=Treponema sp. OMZ 840 TaxID=244313 RepID=UPI003D8AA5A7